MWADGGLDGGYRDPEELVEDDGMYHYLYRDSGQAGHISGPDTINYDDEPQPVVNAIETDSSHGNSKEVATIQQAAPDTAPS